MLNIQNPALFGNSPARGWGGNTEANTLGTFVAAEGSRRRQLTSMGFLDRDMQDDEASLGDPAWHRETQVATQVSDTTDTTEPGERYWGPKFVLMLIFY